MMTSINVLSLKSCSDFMSAPLKLKFFKRQAISDEDTAALTGMLTRKRLLHRCSIRFSGSAMGELPWMVHGFERCAVGRATTVRYRTLHRGGIGAGRGRSGCSDSIVPSVAPRLP